jgi:galactokinase
LADLPAQILVDSPPTSRFFRAPGRVNLIGEHTDYNAGLVLPAALQFDCWVRATPANAPRIRATSLNLDRTAEIDLTRPGQPLGAWSDYVEGVIRQIAAAGIPLPGADLLIWSSVPLGSGLSSSAALEVSVAWAVLSLAGVRPEPLQVARWCQLAEIEFVGMRCGIMDQFIACFGEPGRAILLDCQTLEHRPVELPSGTSLVIANTQVKHELASSAYNQRRQECEEAARQLGVPSLRHASPEMLGQLPPVIQQRARHVVTEIARVESAAATNDAATLGTLMNQSHRSLQEDYEVSCQELDTMAEIARDLDGCFGSRMTGGGFGGCTVSLVDSRAVDSFRSALAERYRRATGIAPPIYVCQASAGAGEWQD